MHTQRGRARVRRLRVTTKVVPDVEHLGASLLARAACIHAVVNTGYRLELGLENAVACDSRQRRRCDVQTPLVGARAAEHSRHEVARRGSRVLDGLDAARIRSLVDDRAGGFRHCLTLRGCPLLRNDRRMRSSFEVFERAVR